MKLNVLVAAMLLASGLVGCDQSMSITNKSAASGLVSTPALPIIQDAVRSLSPTFNGKRVPVLVSQLCALAQGQITAEQNRAQLARLGVDADKLPREGEDAVHLLANGDRAAQAVACAAHQASEVMLPVNMLEVARQVPTAAAPAKAQESTAKAGKVVQGEAQPAAPATQALHWEVDQQAMESLVSLRIAQARADADIFAYIAQRLSETPGLTVGEYAEQARQLFSSLAPGYLKLVEQHRPERTAKFRVTQMDELQLSFDSDQGLQYSASSVSGLTLLQNGQLWLGRGRILDTDYRVQARYFKPSAH